MHIAVLVDVFKAGEDLSHDALDMTWLEGYALSFVNYEVSQVNWSVLQSEVDKAFVVKHIQQLDDIGMAQLLQCLDFSEEKEVNALKPNNFLLLLECN